MLILPSPVLDGNKQRCVFDAFSVSKQESSRRVTSNPTQFVAHRRRQRVLESSPFYTQTHRLL
jgi:hypothetical protein